MASSPNEGESRRFMIKVLIADDHKMFRQGMRMLLEMEPDIKIVGEASDGLEAVEMALSLKPDVVLMDVNMPSLDGVEATTRIMGERPEAAIIVLTMFRDDQHVFSAIQAGARGYILKDTDGQEVSRALRVVAAGGSVLEPALASSMFSQFKLMAEKNHSENPEGLTERELQILALIAAGDSNREIGRKLFLSEKTIKNCVSPILEKLQLTSRTQAAVYAVAKGLIPKAESRTAR
jgi:two-component system, NarL family, response regulator LiaR